MKPYTVPTFGPSVFHQFHWINNGYDIIALVPSCALMLKFEWPLILPNDEKVKNLSSATYDIAEYLVNIAKKESKDLFTQELSRLSEELNNLNRNEQEELKKAFFKGSIKSNYENKTLLELTIEMNKNLTEFKVED